jgi:hypothetical protein
MTNKTATLDSILNTIKKWRLEAGNFRNDGWVQEGYTNKLKEVFSESGKALSDLKKIK